MTPPYFCSRSIMFKTVALAVLMAASCAANAAHNTWDFSYTGFLDEGSGEFLADYTISGSFSGSDSNRDGVLDKSEIFSLVLNGMNFVACAADSNANYHCGTDVFNYRIGGALQFEAGLFGYDNEGYSGGGYSFTSGKSEIDYSYSPNHYMRNARLWTDATHFSITPAWSGSVLPVPEPSTWSMLLIGMGFASFAAIRRRRAAPFRDHTR
ncbi:PEP-CTERM sorting domain-containing protein [Pseudoduganella buxea]|nr:PEP-CTERM sorting domain-containing protein [Pseudoduganella buxea]